MMTQTPNVGIRAEDSAATSSPQHSNVGIRAEDSEK